MALGLRPPASGSQLLPFPAMVAVPLLALLAAPCCPLAKQDGGRLFLLQRLRRRIWSRRQRELLSHAIIAAWRKHRGWKRRAGSPSPTQFSSFGCLAQLCGGCRESCFHSSCRSDSRALCAPLPCQALPSGSSAQPGFGAHTRVQGVSSASQLPPRRRSQRAGGRQGGWGAERRGSQLAAPCRSDPRCHWKPPGDNGGKAQRRHGGPQCALGGTPPPRSNVWGSSHTL